MSLHPKTVIEQAFKAHSDTEMVSLHVETPTGQKLYTHDGQRQSSMLKKEVSLNVSGSTWRLLFEAPSTYRLSQHQILAPTFFLVSGVIFMVGFTWLYFAWAGVRVEQRKKSLK